MVESEDALSGQIRSNADRRDKTKMPYSNPLTGPDLGRRGRAGRCAGGDDPRDPPDARPVRHADQRPEAALRVAGDRLPARHARLPDPRRPDPLERLAHDPLYADARLHRHRPRLGVPTTVPAGPHGGNMDIVETCPGNTVYLPVFVPGGFLYLGDAHAAMGHGELSATGLEMPAETTITVDLLKGKRLAGPRIESPTEIMTIVSGCPMERVDRPGLRQLILWMEADYGWDRWRAYDLLTHVGRISVGYYGIGTVAAKVEKRYLRGS